jgi:hypothetical protein
MFDLQTMGRMFFAAKKRRDLAASEYETLNDQLLELMKNVGTQEFHVDGMTVKRTPYFRLAMKDEAGAIAWLQARGLLERVAKISSAKLSHWFERKPADLAGVEEFVEVHQHERLYTRAMADGRERDARQRIQDSLPVEASEPDA